MKKAFLILKILIVSPIAIILLINVYVMYAKMLFKVEMPKIFGYANVMVISGSMSPVLNVDDLVFIHQQDSYNVNDVITYRLETGSYVTHRIMEIKGSEFITKGDANNTIDDWKVSSDQIKGKVVFSVPKIGVMVNWIRSVVGMLTLGLIALMIIFIPNIIKIFTKKSESSPPEN